MPPRPLRHLFLSVVFLSLFITMLMPTIPSAQASIDPQLYADLPFELNDTSEVLVDGVPTLILSFSVPLNADQEFARFISVTNETQQKTLEPAWVLSDNGQELHLGHLPPEKKLIIEVSKGLKAINGKGLSKDKRETLHTQARLPMLGFASKGMVLSSELAQGLPVLSLNVKEVDVDFFRLNEEALVTFIGRGLVTQYSVYQNKHLRNSAEFVYGGRFDLKSIDNVQQRSLLPIKDIKGLQQPGVYYAVMREVGEIKYEQPAALFSVSDIGLSVHRSKDNLSIFALDINDGKSLADVTIDLLDSNGKTLSASGGKTDKNGYLQLQNNSSARTLLAKKGDQISFLPLNRQALDLSEFKNIGGESIQPTQLFVFGPRSLYRSGETIKLNALLRDFDGKPLPFMPINAKIYTPDGKEFKKFVWHPAESGFYQYELPLAESAPTGTWKFMFDLDAGRGVNKVYHDIQVEDFMPERMAIELSGQERPLAPNENLSINVDGRFLYGAPAADVEARGVLSVRPLRNALAEYPDYVFGSIKETLPTQNLEFNSVRTDAEGHAKLTIENRWSEARSPLELVSQVSLLEAGGRPITRRHIQPVWPADELVGIHGNYKDNSVDTDSFVSFSIIKANAKGELKASKQLKVRLIRERRDYYWSYSNDRGWHSSYSSKHIQAFAKNISVNEKGPTQVEFPVQWGPYLIEVEDPATGLTSSDRFWAGYRWQYNTDSGDVRPDQIRLQIDKPAYQPGDLASVTVQAPHAGSGYLLVESSQGTLWWQNIDVPEQGTDIKVPIDPAWNSHDLYITALVVRPDARDAQKTAKRAVGVLHLPLDRSQRHLQVAFEAAAKVRPSQDYPISVRVKNAKDGIPANARVIISAVDSGILNITNYKTPDPFAYFFARKSYDIDQLDIYDRLIDASKAALARIRFGGDAAMEQAGERAKSHVQIVAWQSEPLTLDSNGKATTSMPLPDFNGELRLMAQVWTDDSFASVEQKTIVAAPLIAELNLPRFLALGDQSTLALELHNLTDEEQNIQLNLTTGAQVQSQEPLPEQISLAAGERKVIPVKVQAEAIGTTDFQLTVLGLTLDNEEQAALKRQWKLDVRSPWPVQSKRITHFLEPQQQWSKDGQWLEEFRTDNRVARVTLSDQPFIDLASFVQGLYDYPYGCSEQTSSRLRPLLHLSTHRLNQLLVKPITEEQRTRLLQKGIEHLLRMQRPDGSFSMWDASGSELPWNTVLATDFLQQASEQGLEVPADRLDKARNRLLRYVRESHLVDRNHSDNQAHTTLAIQSYAAYVLSQQQAVPANLLRPLHARADVAETPIPLLYLAIALQKAGDKARSEELLEKAKKVKRQRYSWLQDYGSSLSDLGWQVYLLQSNQLLPTSDKAAYLDKLIEATNNSKWRSTNENAAIFMALNSLGFAKGQHWEAKLTVGTKEHQLNNEHSEHVLRNEGLSEAISVHNKSIKPLHLAVNVRGVPTQYQPQPHNVLSLERKFFNLDGSPAELDNLTSGTVLVVRIKVNASQSVRDALVVDLLPAGFELENQNLANSSVMLGDIAQFKDMLIGMKDSTINMQAYLDDRYIAAVEVGSWNSAELVYLVRAVTAGNYHLPPAQVQSMYKPDWQAEETDKLAEKVIIHAR